MKKYSLVVVAILGMWFFVTFANAATYYFNPNNPPSDVLVSSTNPISFNVDLSKDFNILNSATLNVWLYDNSDNDSNPSNREKYGIQIGSTLYQPTGSPVEMNDFLAPYAIPNPGTFNLLNYINNNNLIFTLQIQAVSGNFYFSKFQLDVEGTPKSPVPIPAAAYMLGSGLVGLVLIKRRIK